MGVVVTGAAGFLGRALVASLLADGIPVVAVDRRALPWSPPTTPPGGRDTGPGAAVTVVRADLVERDAVVAAALRAADAVFHLAGRPGVRDAGPAADAARARDNVAATAAVLAAVPVGTPLVVTSSSSVYGGAAGRPSREGDLLRPRGGYARSKAAVEELCATRGGPTAVLRPFTVAGEGQRPDMALARWIAAVRAGRPVEILGSPGRSRDVTDVRDLVRAARAAAERGVTGPVNVGTGRPRTLAELAAAVCRAVGAPAELVVRPAAAVEPAGTWADTARCAAALGFVPHTDLDDLVTRQAAATPTADRPPATDATPHRPPATDATPHRRPATGRPPATTARPDPQPTPPTPTIPATPAGPATPDRDPERALVAG